MRPQQPTPFPLSHAQRRIWLLEQVYPNSALGNLSGLLHADGPIDPHRLARAVDAFVAGTPSARLELVPGEGVPMQRVGPVRGPTPVHDFSRAADPLAEAHAWAQHQARTPRPSLEGPLADFAVLVLGAERALLFARVHHVICDAGSLALFSRAVSQHYLGEPCDVLGDFESQVADEAAYLASDKAQADRAAWVETLSRCQPSFRPRPGGSPAALRHAFTLEAEVWRTLQETLRAKGTTFNRFLAAAVAGAQHALGGQSEVTVGSYTHGRWTRPSLRTFGMFVGTSPSPVAVPQAASFDALLEASGKALQKSLRISRYPFDLALEHAGRHGELVYDCLVSFQSQSHQATFAGHPARIEWLFSGAETHALVVHAADRSSKGELNVELDARLDVFPQAVQARLAEGLEQWLRGAAAQVGTGGALRSLSLLGPSSVAFHAEKNRTEAPVPAPPFSRALERLRSSPRATVLHDGAGACSGAELEQLAGGVAAALAKAGVGEGDVVALALPKGRTLVASMLAIAARGATYLPTDGAWPSERLRDVLDDSGAKLVVHHGDAWQHLREHRLPVVDAAKVTPAALEAKAEVAQRAAYLIYTSGSSGRPKGVRVHWRALANFVGAMERALPWRAAERVLAVTSPSFDIFALETWLPLATGVELLLAEGDSAALGPLAQTLVRTPCDVVQLTPSRLQLFLEHPEVRAALRGVRLLLVGGEALPDPLRAQARAALPESRLFNLYGPTETTVWSTAAELTHATRVHVGTPIANTTTAVVSASGFEVPPGFAGELWLGGEGVALGYHARDPLTAERFVTHPSLGRMYRTGDLARWADDGVLEHLGRSDSQVKVGGHRVELQELESILLAQAGVQQAAVVLAKGPRGDAALVAHVVGTASSTELERALRAKVPAPLVPRAILSHASLPTLPSGKLDRVFLAAMALPQAKGEGPSLPEAAAPVVAAWRQVLGRADDADEGFFAAGGTSIRAVQLAAALEGSTGRRISLGAFFAEPTLRALVDLVERSPASPKVAAGTATGPSQEQRRIALALALEPDGRPRDYHLTGVVSIEGPLELAAVEPALQTLVDRHEALRTALVGEAGALRLEPRSGPVRLERREGAATPQALLDGWVTPFDLKAPPFIRAALQQVAENRHWLAVDVHHAAADARSLELLFDELATLLAGQPLPPAAPFFALAQAEDARTGDDDFWRGELAAGGEAFVAAREAKPGAIGLHVDALAPAELEALSTAAARLGVTSIDLALSALSFALDPWDTRPERALLVTVAGRSSEAAWRSVGPFARALPVRLPAASSTTAEAHAREVSRRAKSVLAHSAISPSALQALRGDASPLADVLVAWPPSTVAPKLERGGRTFERLELPLPESLVPLTLVASPGAKGLGLHWTYQAAAWQPHEVEAVAQAFRRALRVLCERPTTPWHQVSFVAERALAREAPPAPDALALVHRHVLRSPEALAVAKGPIRFSYAELWSRAWSLARALERHGVGVETKVAVCCPPAPELTVAMLGTSLAQGAYVLLDPSHPSDRLAALAAQAGCSALVIPEGAAPPFSTLPVIHVPMAAPSTRELSPPPAPGTHQLAYVVFTSGTTALPKAVGLERAQLAAQLRWLGSFFADAPLMRHTFLVSPAVDVAVHQTFAPLLRGDALCFPPDDAALDPKVLLDFVRRERIDVVDSVPSLLDHVLQATSAEAPLECRYLCFGGDTLTTEVWAKVAERARVERIINYYGPTETCLNATALQEPPSRRFNRVPIGEPCTHYRLEVLDGFGRDLPTGALGELVVGGPGVGRGYLGAPQLTAERFVPDPAVPGARRYRTGDLARRLPWGHFEFFGRRDTQVKVRGFRVELAEVEAAVRQCPGVREAAAEVRVDAKGRRSLVAFVVASAGFDARAALEHLRARVPSQLVPSRLGTTPSMPLTAAGKLDRKAIGRLELPALTEPQGGALEGTAALVAQVLHEVLGHAATSASDDFYSLGGDSLGAARVVEVLGQKLGRPVPLRWVLETPEIAALAARLDAEPKPQTNETGPLATTSALTPAQRRLWFLQQLAPESAGYHVAGAVRLGADTALSVDALRAATERVSQAHEALRTRFPTELGVPTRVVGTTGLPVSDVKVGEGELEARLQAFATAPFDLASDAPGRIGLFHEASGRTVLALVLHHLVGDARSLEVLIADLVAALGGAPVEAAPTFSSYAAEDVAFDASPSAQTLAAEWAAHVQSAAEPLELPVDFRRPEAPTGAGRTLRFELSAALSESLRGFARANRTTPYVVGLAAFTTTLARLARRERFLVGVPVHNRHHARWSRLVGSVVNTVPLLAQVELAKGFAAQVQSTATEVAWSLERQRVSFERVVELAAPTRDLSRPPLFSVMFTGEPPLEHGLSLQGRPLEPLAIDLGTSKVDLSAGLHDDGRVFTLEWELGTELFAPATIERWHQALLRLLEHALAVPNAALGLLPFASDAELALERRLNTQPSSPPPTVLHGLWANAEQRPSAPALVGAGVEWSYARVVAEGHRRAHALVALGVRPGDRVLVSLPKSPRLYATWLGVLEAGAAYVPLEPDFPADRAAHLVTSATPVLAITDGRVSTSGVRTVQDFDALSSTQPETPLGRPLHPEQLAYLSYTSGSTGVPKGVAVPHRALAAYAWATVARHQLGPDDRLIQFSSVNFDGSVEELYCPWLAGGAVVLKDESMLDPVEYLRAAQTHQATFLTLTTAYWVELAQAVLDGRTTLPPCVRAVAIGGEKAPVSTVLAWLARVPKVSLVNEYGPTETTVVAATAELREVPETSWQHRQAPLGVPLPGTALWVLDSRLQPRPLGTSGELAIGGPQLAWGYWNDPAQTADRFRPDPCSGTPGARLYRSGDAVVRWADGQIEYVGRVDTQVKLRGFRIELGEVEARLAEHPQLVEVAVVVHGEGNAARLVAHVVASGELESDALVAHARSRLPEPMVPRAIVFHPRLPRSPVGKVERSKLPAPPPEAPRGPPPPLSPDEAAIAQVWRPLLRAGALGPDDDFFALGGHSLLAVQAAAQLEKALGRPVPVRLVFEHPTIAALARALQASAPKISTVRRIDRAALRSKKTS